MTATAAGTTTAGGPGAAGAPLLAVRDLSVEEPDIEDVVRRIYESSRPT